MVAVEAQFGSSVIFEFSNPPPRLDRQSIFISPPSQENELSILEFIHNLVETLDQYFQNVCELDIMFNLERAHLVLDEMVANGHVVEGSKTHILLPMRMMDKFSASVKK